MSGVPASRARAPVEQGVGASGEVPDAIRLSRLERASKAQIILADNPAGNFSILV